MKTGAREAVKVSIGILSLTVVCLAFLIGCYGRQDQDQDEHEESQAKNTAAQISVENGQTFINLDTATQNRLGLTMAALSATVTRTQATFPAVVLSGQDLIALRNSYVASQAQLQKAQVQADVAGKEYARLSALFGEDQNVSEKSVQAAQGTLQSNEADARVAQQQLSLQQSSARQEWGDLIAKWTAEGSDQLQPILDQNELLVQLTIPSATMVAAPKTIALEMPGGSRTQADFLSAFPRVDPRIQGRSFLYIVSARPGLAPGLNLVAHLSVGSLQKGMVIPNSAVVWSEGRAWVYAQISSDQFTRRAVATDVPVDSGFFVKEGFSTGEKVVTAGAQALLSEELFLHGGGGESDEN